MFLTYRNRAPILNESSKRWPKGGQGFGVKVRLIYGLYVSALLFVKVFKNNSITKNPDYYCVKPLDTKEKSPPEWMGTWLFVKSEPQQVIFNIEVEIIHSI